MDGLSDTSPFWEEKVPHYSKQVCFRNFSLAEINNCRNKAKEWYNQQLDTGAWGQNARNALNYYLASIPEDKLRFEKDFQRIYEMIAIKR